jgi:hypothetical protein
MNYYCSNNGGIYKLSDEGENLLSIQVRHADLARHCSYRPGNTSR